MSARLTPNIDSMMPSLSTDLVVSCSAISSVVEGRQIGSSRLFRLTSQSVWNGETEHRAF